MENIESPEESEIKIDYVKIIKEALLFYTTAFFVLLLICRLRTINNTCTSCKIAYKQSINIFSSVSFCFLVPFVIGRCFFYFYSKTVINHYEKILPYRLYNTISAHQTVQRAEEIILKVR